MLLASVAPSSRAASIQSFTVSASVKVLVCRLRVHATPREAMVHLSCLWTGPSRDSLAIHRETLWPASEPVGCVPLKLECYVLHCILWLQIKHKAVGTTLLNRYFNSQCTLRWMVHFHRLPVANKFLALKTFFFSLRSKLFTAENERQCKVKGRA